MSAAVRAARGRWRAHRTAVLTVTALGLLSAAAWSVAHPFGLAAAGVSLLLVEFLGEPTQGR